MHALAFSGLHFHVVFNYIHEEIWVPPSGPIQDGSRGRDPFRPILSMPAKMVPVGKNGAIYHIQYLKSQIWPKFDLWSPNSELIADAQTPSFWPKFQSPSIPIKL